MILLSLASVGLIQYWPSQIHTGSTSSPGLVCDTAFFDFGTVPRESASTFAHDFMIRNTSSKPIKITRTSSSCGCTIAKVPEEAIAPGALITVIVTADWASRVGGQQSFVTLETDEPERPALQLSIKAFLSTAMTVSPPFLNFGRIQVGESESRTVTISHGTVGQAPEIRELRTFDSRVSLHRLPSENPDSVRYRITISGISPGEQLLTKIIVVTHSQVASNITIPISADCPHSLVVVPSTIFLMGQKARGIVELTSLTLNEPNISLTVPEALNEVSYKILSTSISDKTRRMLIEVRSNGGPLKPTTAPAQLKVWNGNESLDVPIVFANPEKPDNVRYSQP